jgi:hypothetical protein
MVENKVVNSGEAVKFNMGLATLENIRNLLNFYHKVSVFDYLELNNRSFKITDTLECQIIKSRTCNHLLLASRPLLTDKQKEILTNELQKTNIKYNELKDKNLKIVKRTPVFSFSVDKACDEFVGLLEDALQDNKVFMPGKGEGSMF